jgi:ADP-ribose pyrophosphatase YjhB (NUDIX family)
MAELAGAGAVVIGPAADAGGVDEPVARRRLALAEVLFVVNLGGYVNDAMAAEIALALRLDVRVDYLEAPALIEAEPELARILAERRSRHLAGPVGKIPVLAPGVLVEIPGPDGSRVVCRTLELDRDFEPGALAAQMEVLRARAGAEDAVAAGPVLHLEYLGAHSPRHAAERAYRRSLPRTVPGAHVLARDGAGRILLVRPAASERWTLPGGGFDAGEYPWQAARREAIEELGLTGFEPGELLAVDQCPPRTEPETRTEYLFDGGVLDAAAIAAIQLPAGELEEFEFVDADRVGEFVTPRLHRRILAALERLADPAAPVALEHGYRIGARASWQWHAPDALPDLPIGQVGGWLFDEGSGRVLLQHRAEANSYALPAGRPEPGEAPLDTLAREAMEESQVELYLNTAELIGGQSTTADPRYPHGMLQLRYAAVIRHYHPIAPDGDPQLAGSRPAYRRLLVDIERAPGLLDFGASGHLQAGAAARAALAEHGLPIERPAPDGYRDDGDPDPRDTAAVSASGEVE